MQDVSQAFSASAAGNTAAPSTPFAAVAYVCAATDPVPLVLVEDSSLPVVVSEYSGRHALSVPEAALLQMYSALGGDVEADEKTGE
jgi:hypothetical protein